MNYLTRDSCRLCESKNLKLVFELTPTPPANAFTNKKNINQKCFPLDVYQCQKCSHVQLLVVVNPEILFSDYVYVSSTSPVFVKHFENYAIDVISNYSINNQDLVVDIGSNDGTLLKFFKKFGTKVLGIDPAQNIAKLATKNGIKTIPSFFDSKVSETILNDYGAAKIITANNVFAHVDDLIGLTKSIKKLLHKNGVFIFEVSYLLDVYEKCLFDMTYHEHLAYHNVISLDRFFNSHGLEFIDIKKINTHGGSIRGYVKHTKGNFSRKKTIDNFIKKEKSAGLNDTSTMKNFGRMINSLGFQLKNILENIKKEGKTISGFGAPAKATTLMYHFGIGPEIIDFIVDDSPLKQGLFSPGMHIPIVSSEVLRNNPPDYLLILAWNFKDSIIEKNKSFHENGGQFIVPLPKIEVV